MRKLVETIRLPFCALLAAVGAITCGLTPCRAQPSVINVEIDYMANANHSHQPSAAEIAAVVQMFACHGITLNAVVDDLIPHINVIADSSGGAPNFFTWVGPNSFRSLRNQYFDNSGGGWHYCIFGHQYDPDDTTVAVSNSSGLGETGGDDFIVTLGSFSGQTGTPFDRAATFAHELGHNLGLQHSAGADTSAGAFSPNYASIMSYQYQLGGVKSQMRCLELVDTAGVALLKDLDYSNGRFPSINENTLNEVTGVGIRGVDWDCNGTIGGSVGQDLDGRPWCAASGARTVLADRNDWVALVDNTFAILPPSRYETCISSDEVERFKMMNPANCPGAQPSPAIEACVGGLLMWADPAYVGAEIGTGLQPYNTFMEAYNAAPNTSVVYLQAGNYSTNGVLETLTKPMILAGPGGATITK